jgi:hypothetical protein
MFIIMARQTTQQLFEYRQYTVNYCFDNESIMDDETSEYGVVQTGMISIVSKEIPSEDELVALIEAKYKGVASDIQISSISLTDSEIEVL